MTAPEDAISLAVESRIDELCDRFEADWSTADAQAIELLVGNFDSDLARPLLLRRLLEVELELSSRGDLLPNKADYLRRFPDHPETIAELFQQLQSRQVENAAVRGEAPTISLSQTDTAAAYSDKTMTSPIPTAIGRFQVVEVLGRGGFGTVYRARDAQMGRDVAIKVPGTNRLPTSTDAQRFLREAKAAAALRHANVCAVHEIGEDNGHPFIVMDFIAGEPLSAIIERGEQLSTMRIIRIVSELALALECVHQQGIIHRDLKPANVIIDRTGTPVIMDFGLARLQESDDNAITLGGDVLGTPAYMPLEQAQGDVQAIGPASDVYSLGAILYELLCGRRPYQGSGRETICQILHAAPTRPSKHDPRVDRKLEAICLKAMARNAGQRYQSMTEFAAALLEYSRTSSDDCRPWYRRSRWVAAAILFVAIAGAVTYIQTDQGWLQIETHDEDVQLVVSQDGRELAIVDTKIQSRVRLRSGEYEIKLQGNRNDITLSRSRFAMTRGDREIVTVRRTSLLSNPPDSHVADSASISSAEGTRSPVLLEGKWRVENGELVTEPSVTEPKQLLIFGDPNWTDYDIEVDVSCERQVLTYSVVFRYTSLKEYWLLSFGGWGPKNADLVSILVGEDGYRHPSRRWLPGTLHGQPGVWQKVEITTRGENIRASVDGKEIAASSHPRLTSGRIGFYTFSPGMVRWRNLKVRALDGTRLWEGFPDLNPRQDLPAQDAQPLSAERVTPTSRTIESDDGTDTTKVQKE